MRCALPSRHPSASASAALFRHPVVSPVTPPSALPLHSHDSLPSSVHHHDPPPSVHPLPPSVPSFVRRPSPPLVPRNTSPLARNAALGNTAPARTRCTLCSFWATRDGSPDQVHTAPSDALNAGWTDTNRKTDTLIRVLPVSSTRRPQMGRRRRREGVLLLAASRWPACMPYLLTTWLTDCAPAR